MLYAGVFCIALATLMLEIDLTRIFSAAMWYHFAFMAISVAMFGMTGGATIVFLRPSAFTPEQAPRRMAQFSLLFALGAIVSLLLFLQIRFEPELSLRSAGTAALLYGVTAVPFVFSGIVITVALTRFPRRVARLYAADLAGAAFGCIALLYTLEYTDALTAVFCVATVAALGAACFAAYSGARDWVRAGLVCAIALTAFAVVHTHYAKTGQALIVLTQTRGNEEGPLHYEKWNSFSRVSVVGDDSKPLPPFVWGMSETLPDTYRIRQLLMLIDSGAGTPLYEFTGDTKPLEFFRYDVTNVAHSLRKNADVLVVGVGGGRDVLSALTFRQHSVLGIELNPSVLGATIGRFREFTGRLDKRPDVKLVVDEARSYITRTPERFDLIQISLIDTWAATAAGAFALSENSLYTVDAWDVFLRKLKPNGILTVSRWFFKDRPVEFYRLIALAGTALQRYGVKDPRNHLIVVEAPAGQRALEGWSGVGTLLASPDPFTDADVKQIAQLCDEMHFNLALAPNGSAYPEFDSVLTPEGAIALADTYKVDLSAPTDDRPYFFNMLRIRDVLSPAYWAFRNPSTANINAAYTLGALTIIVTVFAGAFIVLPLLAARTKVSLRGSAPLLGYFAAIGAGFMFIEIAQLQRLVVFLGHPSYALSTVLFSILLSSGFGSFIAGLIPAESRTRLPIGVFAGLLLIGLVLAFVTQPIIHALAAASTPVRVAVAVLLVAPIGVFLGMGFPLGMSAANRRDPTLTPWLWGVNGAMSVCCSVIATASCLWLGIYNTFIAGVFCYLLAAIFFLRIQSRLEVLPAHTR